MGSRGIGKGTGRGRRLDRRTVLKASAGAAALLATGAAPAAARQGTGTTLAADWIEAERLGLPDLQSFGPVDAEPIPVQADFPFHAIAPHWSGEEAPGASVELSWSADGVTWIGPTYVGEDPDAGRPGRDGRRFGRLVATPWASFVRYRTFDASGQPATLAGFAFSYFDASAGPTAVEVAQPATSPDAGPAPPPIISRAAWGADESLRFRNGVEIWPLEYRAWEKVIVHHSDTMNFEDPVLGLRSIYYFHAVTKGWGDIGYNYVVDFLGNVYEGRIGGENAVGGHALRYNPGTCGICTMGRYYDDPPTPEMRAGLTWITAWVTRNLDPVGSTPFMDIPNLPTISGHRDVNPTSCPGDVLYFDLEPLRRAVRAVQRGRVEPGIPDPEFVRGEVVVTTTDGATLRTAPTADRNVIAPVPIGEVFVVADGPVTNEGYVWYAVRGASLAGWIIADVLERSPDTPPPVLPTPEPTPVPPPEPSPADATPAPPSAEVASTAVPPSDQERAAFQGWSPPPIALGATARVASDALNLRQWPGREAPVVATLEGGAWVTIADGPTFVDGEPWYMVEAGNGLVGWCNGAFLAPL